ncbi:MAG TPA: DMT family transporter [Candidatus Paceibacterota bacterium]|nr:DMT family transporter [Candidatus Paceibacterota bacterium]
MISLAIIFALAAAFFNALASVLQRRAGKEAPPDSLFTAKLLSYLLTHPIWIAGILCQVVAFVFEAAALSKGQLSLVEPIMTVDLLFLLAILYFEYHVPLGTREWSGAVAIILGLSGFLLAANPGGGTEMFHPGAWIVSGSLIALIVLVSVFTARHLGKISRAALLGFVAGSGFALTGAFTKLAVIRLSEGIPAFLTGWQVYALLLVGVSSVLLVQNAYSSGPLSASQPAMMTAASLGAVILGIVLFGDVLRHTKITLFFEALCGVILITGLVILAGSKTMLQDHSLAGEDIEYASDSPEK